LLVITFANDRKFHLATTNDFTPSDKVDEKTDYRNDLHGDIAKKEIYSNTNNTAVDNIINYKLIDTKQENIKLDIECPHAPDLFQRTWFEQNL